MAAKAAAEKASPKKVKNKKGLLNNQQRQLGENNFGAPIEPNYAKIGLNDEQQKQVVDQIEELWPQMVSTPNALTMNKEEAIELLKNVGQDMSIGEEVYDQFFVDLTTKQPLDMVTKEQMQTYSIEYLSDFERQKARTEYEAAKQLYELQMQQNLENQNILNRESWSQMA